MGHAAMSENAPQLATRAIERMVRQQHASQEHYPLLEAVFQGFTLGLWGALRRLAGEDAEVSHTTSALTRFGAYRDGIAPGSLLAVFRIEEWDGEGLVVLDARLVDTVVEALLGGGRIGSRPAEPRALTPADRAVAGRLIRLIIEQLALAFVAADRGMAPVTASLVRIETRPQLVAIDRDDGHAAVATFDAVLGPDDQRGGFEIVLPYVTLAPVRAALLKTPVAERRRPGRRGPGSALALLPATTVTLHAVVDRRRVSLAEITSWEVGTFVQLDTDREQPIAIYCEKDGRAIGQRLCTGHLGAARGRRAIRILDVDGALAERQGETEP
jgi:flagellar motor switch protein FliM